LAARRTVRASASRRRSSRIVATLRRLLVRTLVLALLATALPVACMRFAPPLTTAFIVRHRVDRVLAGKAPWGVEREWVPWEEISPNARLAVVAAEDQKFPLHGGFDFQAIDDAIAHNARGGRVRGASTISQQLAKNLFLWPERSWLRKGLETWFTLWIEVLWPKRRILEVYLNVVEFGDSVYGVEAASRRYFRKPAAKLGPQEAALLAAVLPSPKRLRVAAPSSYVRMRAERIRRAMNQLGARHLAGL
jgi:monofunctional biosynthetic peptidoglycan transglycosylase